MGKHIKNFVKVTVIENIYEVLKIALIHEIGVIFALRSEISRHDTSQTSVYVCVSQQWTTNMQIKLSNTHILIRKYSFSNKMVYATSFF